MQTVTFYSYKGGVGRTLALANVAAYLSNFGFKVCILDFDLEAPGVHYKFPKITYEVNKGLMDCIYDFYTEGIIPTSLDAYSIKQSGDVGGEGEIVVIPAGNVFSTSYWEKLGSVDWHNLFENDGILFFLELKQLIKEEIQPDFLLIDSRTGVTEMSSLCTSILPDKVVFLAANNNENIEGTRQIYRGIQKTERLEDQQPLEIVFALTRFPNLSNKKQELARIRELKEYLNLPSSEGVDSSWKIDDITVLHSDRELELKETLRINEELSDKEPVLRRDYLKLFSRIIPNERINSRLSKIINDITSSNLLFSEPDKVQSNLENLVATYPHPISMEKLIEFYILRNESARKIVEAFNNYWETFGDENKDLIIKYARYFVNFPEQRYYYGVKFELDKIEKYINNYPDDDVVREKLAEMYSQNNNNVLSAIYHYEYLVEKYPDNEEFIGSLLNEYSYAIDKIESNKIETFIHKNESIINKNLDLLVTKARIYSKINKTKELAEIIEDLSFQEALLDYDMHLYTELVGEQMGPDYVIQSLIPAIEKAVRREDLNLLMDICVYYQELEEKEAFFKILKKYAPSDRLVRELEERVERIENRYQERW